LGTKEQINDEINFNYPQNDIYRDIYHSISLVIDHLCLKLDEKINESCDYMVDAKWTFTYKNKIRIILKMYGEEKNPSSYFKFIIDKHTYLLSDECDEYHIVNHDDIKKNLISKISEELGISTDNVKVFDDVFSEFINILCRHCTYF
jgi:hypothetical protein